MGFHVGVASLAYVWWGEAAVARLRASGCTVGPLPDIAEEPAPRPLLLELLADADVVVAGIEAYDAALFAALPQLKLVTRWGAGFDTIDLAAATDAGVLVCRTSAGLTDAVADLTLALMLSTARRVTEADALLRAGGWRRVQGVAIAGRTLGLVGFGPIGQAVARRAAGFGMKLLVCDPYQPDALLERFGAERMELGALLAESDVVSLHCATTPATRGLINAATLAAMKPTAILVNTARGALVDEPALVAALEAGTIAGAGLDTFAAEPLAADAPIRRAPNCVLTPHSGFNTSHSIALTSDMVVDRVLAVQHGAVPEELLNPEVLTSPTLRARLG